MPQVTCLEHMRWNVPTTKAVLGDCIWRVGTPTLRIVGRTDYPNGNVALTATEIIDGLVQASDGLASFDKVFLLSAADKLIAEPSICHGDMITLGGTYQPFDVLLWAGVALKEYTGFSPWSRLWDVLVDGRARGMVQLTKQGYEFKGGCVRSLYQAANAVAEPLMVPLAGLPF